MLTIDNFYQTVTLTYDVADEYGLTIDGTGGTSSCALTERSPKLS